jgi:hypothetical protein
MKRTYISPNTYIDAETLELNILSDSIVGTTVYEENADESDILSRDGFSLWDDEEE